MFGLTFVHCIKVIVPNLSARKLIIWECCRVKHLTNSASLNLYGIFFSSKYLKLSKTEGEDAYDGGKHETTEGDFCVCIRSITLHFE